MVLLPRNSCDHRDQPAAGQRVSSRLRPYFPLPQSTPPQGALKAYVQRISKMKKRVVPVRSVPTIYPQSIR